jgi:uncharacterized protein (UPF0333 family)
MFKRLRKLKGQSTLEYAVLIIIVIGALLSIQVYIKRGVQGRLKSSADDIGDQYKPGATNIIKTTTTVSNTHQTFVGGTQKSTLQGRGEQTNTVNQSNIISVNQEYWGGR